jgi:hypothetical protein
MIKNIKWLCLVSLTFIACNNDDDLTDNQVVYTSGTADFSKFVAVGNSLTAGYTDGALFIKGQENAYPNILAQQFSLAGGGTFTTPYMADNLGGIVVGSTQVVENRLFFNGSGPQRLPGTPSTSATTVLTGPFNNMGVPGAKSFHLNLAGYGALNVYYGRFASSPTAKIIDDAVAQNPTFFSLWIGNNDVLSFATSGGDGVNQTGNLNPATYGPNDITDPTVFASVYSNLVDQLTANGAGGVLANIPNVTTIPYFKTVPTAPLSPTALGGATNIATLNAQLYGPLNQVFTAFGEPDRVKLLSATAANPILIFDEDAADRSAQITGALAPILGLPTATAFGMVFGKARQSTPNDLVVLPASTVIGTPNSASPSPLININGVTYPMADRWVLTPQEQTMVANATTAYNNTIAAIAASKNLAFVDANALLNTIATTGIQSNGFTLTGALVFGNAFSLDGVHPTSRGYAFMANKFIEAINATYGSNLPPVNIGNYNNLYPAAL